MDYSFAKPSLRARRKLIKAYDIGTKDQNASRNSFKLNGK
jgi:hypothetical protein